MAQKQQDEVKSNPFTAQQYGNNTFNPQRVGAKTLPAHGVPKPPKAPEKPLMPYMRYSRRVWDQVGVAPMLQRDLDSFPPRSRMRIQNWSFGKLVGSLAKCGETCRSRRKLSLRTSTKGKRCATKLKKKISEGCFAEHNSLMQVEYERNLKIYHNSPAYQQYMTAKVRRATINKNRKQYHLKFWDPSPPSP